MVSSMDSLRVVRGRRRSTLGFERAATPGEPAPAHGVRYPRVARGSVSVNVLPFPGALDTVNRALDLLARSGGRSEALADVHRYMDIANAELDRLPDNSVKDALRNLATFTVQRVG